MPGLFPVRRRAAAGALALVIALISADARAQQAGGATTSFEEELIELLRRRGVADDAECERLRARAVAMRERADVDRETAARIEEMTARLAQDAPKVTHKRGAGFGFQSADGNFSLTIGGRFQARMDYEFQESRDDFPNFLTPRVRLWFRGKAFDPRLTYDFQFDLGGDFPKGGVSTINFVDDDVLAPADVNTAPDSVTPTFSGADQLAELKDAFLNYEISGKGLQVRAGQFKAPYSRHQLTSVGRLSFVDRSPTDRFFAAARQKGAMLHGTFGGEKDDLFEYGAGVFDGEGENRLNDDEGLMYAARAVINPFGATPYWDGDLRADGERYAFRAALGVNAWYHQEDGLGVNNSDAWSIGADVAAMWRGFYLLAEAHYRETDRATAPPSDQELVGWFAQLSYFVVPQTLEVGVRYAEVDWENPTAQSASREYLAVIGYYFEGHDLKAQIDFGRVENRFLSAASVDDDWRLRLQVTLVF